MRFLGRILLTLLLLAVFPTIKTTNSGNSALSIGVSSAEAGWKTRFVGGLAARSLVKSGSRAVLNAGRQRLLSSTAPLVRSVVAKDRRRRHDLRQGCHHR